MDPVCDNPTIHALQCMVCKYYYIIVMRSLNFHRVFMFYFVAAIAPVYANDSYASD